MTYRFDDEEFVTQHAVRDPAGDRPPTVRHVLLSLAVLALVGIHWMPMAAWLDGADPATVGAAVLEMWGLATLVLVGAGLIIAVVLALGSLIGRVLASVDDAAGWPAAEDEDP